VQIGCHSLIFGALPPEHALTEIARANFACAVLAEIQGQAQHASSLTRVPPLPIAALDVATHDPIRIRSGVAHASRLGVGIVVVTPGSLGERSVPERLAVTPRAGSAVWNVESALHLARKGVALWPDTSHLARAGETLVAAVGSLAPYSAGWFVRDHDGLGPGPGSFESQVPGRGVLDLNGALKALQDAGFAGPVIFHAVGHLPEGRLRPGYPLERIRDLAKEARDYLSRYSTSSADRPT
jgi:sugar phosphate isomerase/epimerase